MERKEWNNLYKLTWANLLKDGDHPAKFRPGLAQQIYRYLKNDLKLPVGSEILDPFAGIAGGALFAIRFGYNWTGYELEKHFVAAGVNNINYWQSTFGPAINGNAEIYQRDSTEGPYTLKVSAIVSSPPFGAGETRNRTSYQDGEIASMMSRAYTIDNQAQTPGNLAAMLENMATFDAIVSSPPYEDVINRGDGPGARWDSKYHSPENSDKISTRPSYGQDPRQLGKTARTDFWFMARQVVSNCYHALLPGGYAIWVCKDYVRNGELVQFSDRWEQLCNSAGFETVERINASLIVNNGKQPALFDNIKDQVNRKEYKSMFRRLAEAKGSPRIDHEDVIVMRKPEK